MDEQLNKALSRVIGINNQHQFCCECQMSGCKLWRVKDSPGAGVKLYCCLHKDVPGVPMTPAYGTPSGLGVWLNETEDLKKAWQELPDIGQFPEES